MSSSRLALWAFLAGCGEPLPPAAHDAATDIGAPDTYDAATDIGAPDSLVVGPNDLLIRVRGPSAQYIIRATGSPEAVAHGDLDLVRTAVPDMTVAVSQTIERTDATYHHLRMI